MHAIFGSASKLARALLVCCCRYTLSHSCTPIMLSYWKFVLQCFPASVYSWQDSKEHGQSCSGSHFCCSVHEAVQGVGWPDRCVGSVWWEETPSGGTGGDGRWRGILGCTGFIQGTWCPTVSERLQENCFVSEGMMPAVSFYMLLLVPPYFRAMLCCVYVINASVSSLSCIGLWCLSGIFLCHYSCLGWLGRSEEGATSRPEDHNSRRLPQCLPNETRWAYMHT